MFVEARGKPFARFTLIFMTIKAPPSKGLIILANICHHSVDMLPLTINAFDKAVVKVVACTMMPAVILGTPITDGGRGL